jgi:predicted transglutaminase-like cysteine proteinase
VSPKSYTQELRIIKIFVMATTLVWASVAEAAFFILPPHLQLNFTTPAFPPIGHTWFCVQYPDDCKVHGIDFRRRKIRLTPQRLNELNAVNREVNHDITPEKTIGYGTTDWIIAPHSGDCKSYAITKRHQLLARGWPSRTLLLAEVTLPTGEDHLILVVRMADMDLVLDNLDPDVKMATLTYRRWVRIETPQNPKLWSGLQVRPAAASTQPLPSKRQGSMSALGQKRTLWLSIPMSAIHPKGDITDDAWDVR